MTKQKVEWLIEQARAEGKWLWSQGLQTWVSPKEWDDGLRPGGWGEIFIDWSIEDPSEYLVRLKQRVARAQRGVEAFEVRMQQ